ncbi:DUF2182 domain-containing protein [Aquibium sp. ELW1220]|uniref:copper chaperone n=1 Tax=Aquibium sp. ELW1220 TaxID=2976766 RepID=UPI0025AF7B10|nr:DUF2182 domain-containing protein [Aquibium sp. ELW1220]MDN2584297.1 DUF2182 domain-containing protein [Aquibium sp. ELW1220]
MRKRHLRIVGAVAATSAAGWVVLLLGGPILLPVICGEGWTGVASVEAFVAVNGLPAVLAAHGVMVAAMMTPLLVPSLLSISDRVFARKRLPAMLAFSLGYAAFWLVFGSLLTVAHAVLSAALPNWQATAVATAGLCLVWHALPWRQRFLNRCHVERPLAGHGIVADATALTHGCRTAASCAGACAAPMLFAMACGPFVLPAMLAVAAFLWIERILPPERPGWGLGNHLRTARRIGYMARSWPRFTRHVWQRHGAARAHA